MNIEDKNEKRTFDPTVNFSFFGSWMSSIEAIEQANGVESAYLLFKAIANYSMYDEQPDFSNAPIMYALWAIIEREIDISIGKRKRNFANDELDENIQKVKSAFINNPNASVRDVERMTGVGKSTVDRIRRKYKQEIENACASMDNSASASDIDSVDASASDVDSVDDSVCDSDVVIDSDNDNDTMGRDSNGTVGQQEEYNRLDKIRHRLTNPNILKMNFYESSEHLGHAMSVRGKWRLAYKAWKESISNEAAEAIVSKYLASHEETPELKRFGDLYGRIISGWNAEANEPIISYSVTGAFPPFTKHDISSIPVTYYMESEEVLEIDDEESAFRDWIREQESESISSYEEDSDLPF